MTKYGRDNEGQEENTGYTQAVSGLCKMTEEHDRMFTAEGKYWLKFKQNKPELWKAQVQQHEPRN